MYYEHLRSDLRMSASVIFWEFGMIYSEKIPKVRAFNQKH